MGHRGDKHGHRKRRANAQITRPQSGCAVLGTIPGVSVSSGTLRKPHTFYSTRWGNVLSPYWMARAMAELGGHAYSGGSFGQGTWMELLPHKAPAKPAQAALFQAACRGCTGVNLEYAHRCFYGWTRVLPTIQRETRLALTKFSERRSLPLPQFEPDDWFVYDRCEIFRHPIHAPFAFSLYDEAIPCDARTRVLYFRARRSAACDVMKRARAARLRRKCPQRRVEEVNMSRSFHDFARLVLAPHVILGSAGSSWGIWSALSANAGEVWVGTDKLMPTGAFAHAPNVHTSRAPGLYTSTIRNHTHAAMVQWLESH